MCTCHLQEQDTSEHNPQPSRPLEEWMLICQRDIDLQPSTDSLQDIDWTQAAQSYPNVDKAPSFISKQRQAVGEQVFNTTANPAGEATASLHHHPATSFCSQSITTPNDCLRYSWHREVVPHPLSQTSPPALTCCSTHWCGCLQHQWSHSSLSPQPPY